MPTNCPHGQVWFQPECFKAPCSGYCGTPNQLPAYLGLPSVTPPEMTIQTHPATTIMNPAAPATQVVAAGVPATQQSDPVQGFLQEYNISEGTLKAQIGPKIATAALFWIGGKVLGLFGKK